MMTADLIRQLLLLQDWSVASPALRAEALRLSALAADHLEAELLAMLSSGDPRR